jgi:protein involved in polysaccharide export with SLBB domain
MPRLQHRLPAPFLRLTFVAGLLTALPLHAQDAGSVSIGAAQQNRLYASRASLQTAVDSVERLLASAASDATRQRYAAEAQRLQARLRDGDIQPGDRVVLVMAGEGARRDTVVVSGGRTITVAGVPEFTVAGVLRSELQQHVTTQLARYIKTPDVIVTPLVRLTVLGEVARPGFVAVPADALLSDVIMLAGGPTAAADLSGTTIRRSGVELYAAADIRVAVADGHTLDRLHLRAGDEILVGKRRQVNWMNVVQVVGALGALAGVITAIAR